jgi:hypothetical protein
VETREEARGAIVCGVRTERSLQRFLLALVATPGLASGAALVVSFIFAAPSIAAREHLGPFAHVLAACSGCSLCGMSRAFASLSHGDLEAAIAFNPGVLLLWPLAWALLGVSLFGVYRLWREPVRFFAPPASPAFSPAFSNVVAHPQETP